MGVELRKLEIGDAEGLVVAFERVAGEDAVFALADEKADGVGVAGALEKMVRAGNVAAELAQESRLERFGLDFHDDVAMEADMVEEEIGEEFGPRDVEAVFAAHEGETVAEFEEEFFDVGDEGGLEFFLREGFGQLGEIEGVGIFDELAGEIGADVGKGAVEVGEGAALALVEPGVDVMGEDGARPAVAEGFGQIKTGRYGVVGEFVDDGSVVAPWNLEQPLLRRFGRTGRNG